MIEHLSMCKMRTMSSCSAPKASSFSIATRPSFGQSGLWSTWQKIKTHTVLKVWIFCGQFFFNKSLQPTHKYRTLDFWHSWPCPRRSWNPRLEPMFHLPEIENFVFFQRQFFFYNCSTLTIQSSISRSRSCSSVLQKPTTARTRSSKSLTCCKLVDMVVAMVRFNNTHIKISEDDALLMRLPFSACQTTGILCCQSSTVPSIHFHGCHPR